MDTTNQARKVGIVTGAGRGIGRALVLGLINDGFQIAGVSRTSGELAEVQAAAEKLRPGSFHAAPCDVADRGAVATFVSAVLSKWKRVDVLVNNAGIFRSGTSELASAEFAAMLEVNLMAA